MKTIRTTTVAAALTAMVMMACVTAAIAASNAEGLKASVEQGMERLVGAVIEAVSSIDASSEGEREEAVRGVVEDIVMPNVDTATITRRIVGKRHWANATPAQRATLITMIGQWISTTYAQDDRRIQRRSRGAGPRGNADAKREGADQVRDYDRREGDEYGIRAGDRPSAQTMDDPRPRHRRDQHGPDATRKPSPGTGEERDRRSDQRMGGAGRGRRRSRGPRRRISMGTGGAPDREVAGRRTLALGPWSSQSDAGIPATPTRSTTR